MLKSIFTTKRICRAGIIAALYVALTYALAPFAFGPFQLRPAEALTILPLFYAEAIPALYVGCLLANIASPFAVYDLTIGPLVTLAAALCTFFVGRALRKFTGRGGDALKIGLGGIFPVLFNAFVIPAVIVFLCSAPEEMTMAAYWTTFGSFVLTQSVWIYALGTPLYLFIAGMRKKGVAAFLDGKKKVAPPTESAPPAPQA